MFRVHGGCLSIHCPSHIPKVNLGLRGTTLHTCSSQPNNFPPTVLSPNNQLKVYLPLELCVFLIYAMPTGGGESAKTGSEKWAIWWQTAMSLLCSEAWAITVTGCLFFPGVSQQVAPLWILSPLSYGPLHLVYLEVSPPTLFKGLIPLNKKKGSYMWWLTVSCRHDFKQSERKMCGSDKGLEWTMNSAKKINWIGPRLHHDQETLALYHEKRFASRHPSSVTRLMTRLG